MSPQLSNPLTGSKCFIHLLYSIIYGSLCILLVFLGVIWCTSAHAHAQSVNNLANHRMDGEARSAGPSFDSKEARYNVDVSSPTVRRSYQNSGFGANDYGSSSYGSSSDSGYGEASQQQQQGFGSQQQQQQPFGGQPSGTIGRQFGSMYGGAGAGGFPPGGNYYPPSYGLENRFLSLFPRRSSFYQPYYPFGPFGSALSTWFPQSSPYAGGQQQYGAGGAGGGYPMGGGGLGGYGPLSRLAQASSLLSGLTGLGGYRDRLSAAAGAPGQVPAQGMMMDPMQQMP